MKKVIKPIIATIFIIFFFYIVINMYNQSIKDFDSTIYGAISATINPICTGILKILTNFRRLDGHCTDMYSINYTFKKQKI